MHHVMRAQEWGYRAERSTAARAPLRAQPLQPGFSVHIQEAGEWPKESHHTESDTQDTRCCSAGGLTINQQL